VADDPPRVRRAREDDVEAVVPLLHLTATDMYERLAGSRERALRIIADDLRRGLRRATWVAERGGAVAGAMVAYPYGDAPAQTRSFVTTVARSTPPWRWPAIGRLLWRGHRRSPEHPPDWLYVDALATAPEHRRRGVASALLREAERIAAAAGLRAIALDTPDTNEAALRLYEGAGFRVDEVVPAKPPIPGGVVLVKDVARVRN
jgi:ribosomal protein S18 acetylase RimI-like enzyme